METSLTLPERELKELNTFVVRGNQLKQEATDLVVENSLHLDPANALFKRVQEAEKDIETKRTALVKPLNDFVKQINGLAKECAQPAAEAKLIISRKLLAYNEKVEAERRARAEEERKALEAQRLKEEAERKAREEAERKAREAEEARLAEIARKQEEERRKIEAEQDALKKREMEIEAKRLEEEKRLEEQRIANEQAQRKLEEDRLEVERQKKQMEEEEQKRVESEKLAAMDAANKVKGVRTGYKFEIVDENKVPRIYCSPDSKKINAAIKAGVLSIEGILIEEDKRIQ